MSQNATNNTIQDDITHIRETIITNLTNANNEMSERIDILDDKIIKLEKQLAISAQRSRENNIEIHGIDDRVTDNLESTVIRVIKLLDIDCSEDDIQGCHRLPVRKGSTLKPTIIKFVNRKKAEKIYEAKSKLKDCDFTSVNLPEGTKLYINLNLSPSFKELDYFCRKLKKNGNILSYVTTNTNINIKIENNYHKIIHLADLRELFPDITFESKVYK